MSVQAQNIKIITQSGVVTLRGPVKTAQEKTTIEALAKGAGATRIANELEIDRDVTSGKKD
jgi:osmotically-inducible protein OsmY